MDTNTSQPFVLNRPDGKSLSFPILSPSSRIKLRNEFRLFRKTQLAITMRLLEASGDEVKGALNAFDATRLPESVVEEWINQLEGQVQAIALSLKQANPATDESAVDNLGLSDTEILEVAAGVMRMKVTYTEPKESADANPTTAETEPTGAETPA